MRIPFLDLKSQYNLIKPELDKEFQDIFQNTAFICGKRVKEFENNFAKTHDLKYCLGMSSGTDALHTAYWSLGIGISSQIKNGYFKKNIDEVIVPVNTYIATSETISISGAKPVFVDHDEDSYNIDPKIIENRITENTKAIVAVHLYGQTADMDPIIKIAQKNNLYLIEDCSQAHLAEYKGEKLGKFSDVATFSFYPGKNLGAYGEAGAVLTNNDSLYNKMLRFRQHGALDKYHHEIEGHNYRMEEFQAAVLNVKLQYLDKWTIRRREIASIYNNLLGDLVDYIRLPKEMPYAKHVYHQFEIRVNKRGKLKDFLNQKGIEVGIHYPVPLHLQPAYKYLNYKEGEFPVAEKSCKEILSLPIFPEMTDDQINYVTESIKQFFRK